MQTQCVSSYSTQPPHPEQTAIFLDELSEPLSIIQSNYDRMIITEKSGFDNPADSHAMDLWISHTSESTYVYVDTLWSLSQVVDSQWS